MTEDRKRELCAAARAACDLFQSLAGEPMAVCIVACPPHAEKGCMTISNLEDAATVRLLGRAVATLESPHAERRMQRSAN
jgi:hypothetical protein